MAVCWLVLSIRSFVAYFRFVPVWETRLQSEVLLRLVRLYCISIEVGIHRDNLRLNHVLDFFADLIDVVRGDFSRLLSYLFPVVWSKNEESVDDGVMVAKPLLKLGAAIVLVNFRCCARVP